MNEESIFIADFKNQCIREKVMMNQPDDDDPWYQEKYEAHVDSRRTFPYPVSKEQDGKELREGVDFEIKQQVTGGRSVKSLEGIPYDYHTYTKEVAIPIEPEKEDNVVGTFIFDHEKGEETFEHNPNFGKPIDNIGETDRGDEEGLPDKPKIVCLCGSTRFMEAFQEANLKLTCEGKIVLSVGCNTKSDRDLLFSGELTEELKNKLDELHKRKIDLADEVFVLNVGGYIGESTRSEINYAKDHNKPIKYLVP